MPVCTRKRLLHTQVCPVLRYLEAMAPATAASRSASSKTIKGALPPSSSDNFLMVGAHCAMSRRPTSVEPVKDSLRTTGLEVNSPPMARGSPVTTLKTPAGTPARAASSEGQRRQRCQFCRFEHHGAACCQCGCDLAGNHRSREVPWRDGGADADRLLDSDQPAVAEWRGNDFTVGTFPFFCKPVNIGSGIGDFALGFGQRFALLGGHQACQIVLMLQQ